MPIDDSQDFDLDTQESIVLEEDTDVQEDNEAADDSQDDEQDDSNLEDSDDSQDDDSEQDDDSAPAPKKSSSQNRYQALSNRAKAAEAEAERHKNALTAERERLNVERQATENAKELERISQMQPHERDAYEAKRDAAQTKQAMQLLHFQMKDSSDKSIYTAKAISNPLYAKYADRVEAKLTEMRKQGQNSDREVILDFLIGRDARLKAESGAAAPRRKSAAARIDAAQSRPAKGRSDAGYKPRGKTAEDRLEGVYI